MIKKLQIKFISIIMIIVTIMLITILGTIALVTSSNIRSESMRILLNIHDMPAGSFTPYITIKVDRQSEYMFVEGKYYEDSNIDFIKLVEEVDARNENIGDLTEYNLRYLKEHTPQIDSYTFIDISNEIIAVQSVIKSCYIAGAFSFIAFLVLAIILVKWITRPLEKAWEQQKQFIGDASHELKTPLTVILTNAELLEDPDSAEEDKSQYINNIHSMSLQMRGLVEQLLELARADNGTLKTSFERLSLSDIANTEVMMFEPSFFDKNLILQSEIAENIYINGSQTHVKQAIDILLDNAIKYTKDNGNVTLTLKKTVSGKCQLSVESEGTPLTKEEIENIFKRFYRADKARSINGSYGLGLSIAVNIMKQHGGRIFASSKEASNVFTLEFKTIK